jgi:hypothetical protein
VPVKRYRFIRLFGGTRSVNRELITNLQACPDGTPVTAEFVIAVDHQLFQIEKSFRMAKSDLQARPVYHRTRDSIEAHLTIVFAALAVSPGSKHELAGRSASSSRPPAATAPSRSRPASTSLPPPTRYPTTSATHSTRSATPAAQRTDLIRVGTDVLHLGAVPRLAQLARDGADDIHAAPTPVLLGHVDGQVQPWQQPGRPRSAAPATTTPTNWPPQPLS